MKKIIIFISAILLLFCTNASAEDNTVEIEKNYSANEITVSGSASENEAITVQILKDDENLSNDEILSDFSESDNPEELIVYTGDCVADSDGSFTFSAGVSESGNFVLYIFYESKNDVLSFDFSFVSARDYAANIIYVNAAADKDEFVDRLTEKLDVLGLSGYTLGGEATDTAEIAELVYDNMGSGLDENNTEANLDLYKKCAAMSALNNKTATNVAEYISDIYLSDNTMKSYWEKHVNTTAKEKYLTKKMSGKEIKTLNELEEAAIEALVLTAVKYPDGYSNIRDIFNTYKAVLGLTSVSSKDSVYKALADIGDFENTEALVKKYKSLLSSSGGNQGTSGNGSGSSGGVSMNNSYTPIAVEGESIGELEVLKLKFTDLDSVMWAYPAISVLCEEGIVNGISETEFAPEENVTREQFVKLLIAAMNCYDEGVDKNVFSDVSESDWFCKYVNIANELQIVQGIGDGMFGTGLNITRQDMAVMLVNALKYNGVQMTQSDFTFSDEGETDDYAKEAVSCLYNMGIVNGVSATEFAPKAFATRAEAAKIIYEALKVLR